MIASSVGLTSFSVGSRIILLAAGIVGLLGLSACSDTAHAADAIRGRPLELDRLTAGLVGQTRGVRIRYEGPKRGPGFRLVVSNSEGEVVATQDMGVMLGDPAIRIDHVAVVTLEQENCPSGDQQRLIVRCAALDGSSAMTSSTHIDEYIPEGIGSAASSWPLGPEEVGDDEGLPVFFIRYGGIERTLRVEFCVQ